MRNVIVTGASRGLGLAIGTTLAAAGYRVIAVARTETEEVRAAAAACEREQRGAIQFRAFDLTNITGMAAFVGDLRKEFGPLYGLVNNAGLGTAGVLTMMRDEQIEDLIRLNTLSPIILSKYVLRSMMIERAGRIVNISSIVADTGYSGLSAYSATKAALVGFTRSTGARSRTTRDHDQCNRLQVSIDTEMTHELTGGQREQIMRRSALRRMASRTAATSPTVSSSCSARRPAILQASRLTVGMLTTLPDRVHLTAAHRPTADPLADNDFVQEDIRPRSSVIEIDRVTRTRPATVMPATRQLLLAQRGKVPVSLDFAATILRNIGRAVIG